MDGLRLTSEPALCDVCGLERVVASAMTEGMVVFTFEETERFSLPDDLRSRLVAGLPDALGLWRAWAAADEDARRRWSAEIPQPIYLKPPHITPGKSRPFPFVRG